MNKYIRISSYFSIVIILLMMFYNPTLKDFKEHIGYNEENQIVKRVNNYLIFSIYEVYTIAEYSELGSNSNRKTYHLNGRNLEDSYIRQTYYGWMKNFW